MKVKLEFEIAPEDEARVLRALWKGGFHEPPEDENGDRMEPAEWIASNMYEFFDSRVDRGRRHLAQELDIPLETIERENRSPMDSPAEIHRKIRNAIDENQRQEVETQKQKRQEDADREKEEREDAEQQEREDRLAAIERDGI